MSFSTGYKANYMDPLENYILSVWLNFWFNISNSYVTLYILMII